MLEEVRFINRRDLPRAGDKQTVVEAPLATEIEENHCRRTCSLNNTTTILSMTGSVTSYLQCPSITVTEHGSPELEMYLRKFLQLGKSFPPDFLSVDFLWAQECTSDLPASSELNDL